MKLAVADVLVNPTIQLRSGSLDMDRVEAMAEYEAEGGQLPPITVVGSDNLLADGHHRHYLAVTTGRLDIDANRIDGGLAEAIVASIINNDISTAKPLTRTERNKGIKLLLEAGWSQQAIADATGIHRTTIVNIGNAQAMRGALPKATKAVGGHGGATPKPVAVLPTTVHEKLNDTTLVRIADAVPFEQQGEFAAAVAERGLSEPRVREAIKELRAGGVTPTEAVESATPRGGPMPKNHTEIARAASKRLTDFIDARMVIDGREHDFWQVLEVLAAQQERIVTPGIWGLQQALTKLAVQSEFYATKFASKPELQAVEA